MQHRIGLKAVIFQRDTGCHAGEKICLLPSFLFLSKLPPHQMINFPVPLRCRQCLCSFYYLSCSGRGSSVPLVNHTSLQNISSGRLSLLSCSSRLPPRAAAGSEADSSCKPQKGAFLSHPYQSFSDSHGWHCRGAR